MAGHGCGRLANLSRLPRRSRSIAAGACLRCVQRHHCASDTCYVAALPVPPDLRDGHGHGHAVEPALLLAIELPSRQFPFQLGATLNVSDIGYKTIMLHDVMQRLNVVETLAMPNNWPASRLTTHPREESPRPVRNPRETWALSQPPQKRGRCPA
jgi:hypothetical protein